MSFKMESKVHCLNRLLQLGSIIVALAIGSCTPATQTSPSYPNPTPMRTETRVIVSSPTARMIPTETATIDPRDVPHEVPPELLFTATPDPNAFATSAEITEEYSQEEIARVLFTKWLDHFLSETISPVKRLDEYKIDQLSIPFDQRCAPKLGGVFVAEARIIMKTTLPLASSTGNQRSDWTAGGGNIVDSYHKANLFRGVIYQSGTNYTLEVIMQIPLCDLLSKTRANTAF